MFDPETLFAGGLSTLLLFGIVAFRIYKVSGAGEEESIPDLDD